ncbi:hypothetical protein ACDW_41700 [Acidovorax sp. DW039]|nr:hypothetical protein ACDW_41700 [Acidovorax sp. DW039]
MALPPSSEASRTDLAHQGVGLMEIETTARAEPLEASRGASAQVSGFKSMAAESIKWRATRPIHSTLSP